MSTPTPNIEKLDKLVEWATAEDEKKRAGLPSEWRQHYWTTLTLPEDKILAHCGTACCIAGKVVYDNGALPVLPYYVLGENNHAYNLRSGNSVLVSSAVYPDGGEVFIPDEASRLLGLNAVQANALFEGGNDLADIVRIVADIKAGDEYPAFRDGVNPSDYEEN